MLLVTKTTRNSCDSEDKWGSRTSCFWVKFFQSISGSAASIRSAVGQCTRGSYYNVYIGRMLRSGMLSRLRQVGQIIFQRNAQKVVSTSHRRNQSLWLDENRTPPSDFEASIKLKPIPCIVIWCPTVTAILFLAVVLEVAFAVKVLLKISPLNPLVLICESNFGKKSGVNRNH